MKSFGLITADFVFNENLWVSTGGNYLGKVLNFVLLLTAS